MNILDTELALAERIKELNALYRVSRALYASGDIPLESRLQNVVDLIPGGWLYPEITAARLRVDEIMIQSDGFRETPWLLSARVDFGDTTHGQLDVVLLEEREPRHEGPFLREERDLIDGIAGIVGEAMRRNSIEAELRRSEERFRLIAEHIEHVFWIRTLANRGMDYVSPAYERVWGRSSAELLVDSRSWLNYLFPADRARIAALTDGDSLDYEVEYRIVRPDGDVRWIHDRAYLVQDGAPGGQRVLGVAVDVTLRKQLEQRFGLLSQEITDVICVVGTDGIVQYCSSSVQDALGYSSVELVGMNMLEVVHPDDRALVEANFARIVGLPGHTTRAEYRVLTRAGDVRNVETVSRSLVGDPAIGGVLVTARDITERLDIEGKLRESQRLQAIGRLAGGIAHDFNNILTVIRSQTELLLLDFPDRGWAHEVEIIQASADRAATLTAQLLAFSRDQVLRPRVVDLRSVVSGMDRILDRVVGERITIQYDLPPNVPCVMVDPAQMEQVILNLAVNARDAMPDGGTLGISVRKDESDNALLEVLDTGTGMTEEVRLRVFEPFFTTKPPGKGTGLGLAMAYGLVTQSGGTIEVVSAPGDGTRVCIRFPAIAGGPETIPPAAPAGHSAKLTGRILVVEDDVNVRRVTATLLERAGLRVLAVDSAESALDVLASDDVFDFVLTDLGMPGMSGHELVDRIRSGYPHLPLVVMSGYDTSEDGQAMTALPRDVQFLQKPFTRKDLLDALQRTTTESLLASS